VTQSVNAFIQRAKAMGAKDAKIIPSESIKTAAWVVMKCRYGCDGFGNNLCCPPNTLDYKAMQDVLDCYSTALLIQCGTLEQPSEIVLKLEKFLFSEGYHKAMAFGAGKCTLCKECSKSECNLPLSARPSMEACGIDVYETVRANGYPIGFSTSNQEDLNCYGIVLIE
jgi:predicted metal-binding protein